MRVDICKTGSYGGYWLHVDRQSMGCGTKWSMHRKAKEIAKAHFLVRQAIPTKPYSHGFSITVPVITYSDDYLKESKHAET